MPEVPLLRSYLYAPGSRPDRLAKACRAGADAVIFDLEDAVARTEKEPARQAVAHAVHQAATAAPVPGGGDDPARRPQIHVRINRERDGYDERDLLAVAAPGLAGLRLPKAADPAEVAAVGRWLDERERATGVALPCLLYPTVESAAGVLRAGDLAAAHPRVARLAYGAADLLADLGVPGNGEAAGALPRGLLVLRSRAGGLGAPVDAVYPHVHDDAGLRAEAGRARAQGFFGKSVIHPRQVPVVHAVFTPAPDEVAAAWRTLDAFHTADQHGEAALLVDGEFVDLAVVARARQVVTLADLITAPGTEDAEGGSP